MTKVRRGRYEKYMQILDLE